MTPSHENSDAEHEESTAPAPPPPPATWWWAASCALLAALALWLHLASPWALTQLDWQPRLARDEPWRWWSAALIHWSDGHLWGNLLALLLLGVLGHQMRLPRNAVLAWLTAWPFIHLALLVQPGLAHYAGLSGVLHAGMSVAAVWAVGTLAPEGRRVGWLLLAGLAIKLAWEEPWEGTLRHIQGGWGTAPLVHASGALVGVVSALLALARGTEAKHGTPEATGVEVTPQPPPPAPPTADQAPKP